MYKKQQTEVYFRWDFLIIRRVQRRLVLDPNLGSGLDVPTRSKLDQVRIPVPPVFPIWEPVRTDSVDFPVQAIVPRHVLEATNWAAIQHILGFHRFHNDCLGFPAASAGSRRIVRDLRCPPDMVVVAHDHQLTLRDNANFLNLKSLVRHFNRQV